MKNQSINQKDFYKTTLVFDENLFEQLFAEIEFENISKGRLGNQLVKVNDLGVPIVRTTTKYTIPAHNFSSMHHRIVDCINESLDTLPTINFNNALIEVYDERYHKMGYHSDQCLDLAPNSYIGLFSCYENPDELTKESLRVLQIRDKVSKEEFEISLTHNSFILFSLETNSKFSHKIITKPLQAKNRWLGITFRESKTFINFKNNVAYFQNGDLFELAKENEEREYYKLRGEENRSLDFSYPKINYTLSVADMIVPI